MTITDMPKNIYIFVGPPGSGKGSLANLCFERFGWDMLSTGNLCRRHIVEQTEIGKEIDFAIKSGRLVSDELISQMVEHWLSEKSACSNGVILDGYPRTLKQAKFFNDLLKNSYKQLKLHIVQLSVSDEVVVDRLFFRFTCSNKECQAVFSLQPGSSCKPKNKDVCDRCGATLIRRVDDEIDAIQKRLQVYYKHANDFLDYYEEIGFPVVKIDADKSLESVFQFFLNYVGIVSV